MSEKEIVLKSNGFSICQGFAKNLKRKCRLPIVRAIETSIMNIAARTLGMLSSALRFLKPFLNP